MESLISKTALETFAVLLLSRLYLDDKGLVLEAGTHPQLAHVGRFIDEVLDAVENAAARGRDSTVDSSLADGFAGDAGVSVDVLGGPRANITYTCD